MNKSTIFYILQFALIILSAYISIYFNNTILAIIFLFLSIAMFIPKNYYYNKEYDEIIDEDERWFREKYK